MAAPDAVDVSALDGYFKERYGDALEKVIPEFAIVAKDIKFKTRKKNGRSFNVPVRVRRGMGWTFDNTGDAFDLNAAHSGVTQEAVFTPTQFIHREKISYTAASQAQGSKQAFGDVVDETVRDMTESGAFARELCLLYGGQNIGVVSSSSGSGGVYDVVITDATWAAGIWSQAEGLYVDVYTSGGSKRNSANDVQVTGVDHANKTVELTGDNGELTNVTGTDYIVPKGAEGVWFNGMRVIAANTGTLFSINGATYSKWTGNTKTVTGALSLGKVLSACSLSTVRGGMGKLCAYVSTYSWEDLNNDHAALRRFGDEAKREVVLGTKSIKYFATNGEVEIKPHPMIKAGEAMVIPPDKFERRGSTDLTFKLPNVGPMDGQFFRHLSDNAGFEMRCWWDQGLFARNLARCVLITGIENNSL